MQHIWDIRSLRLEGCELTIGSFDGVHRGHQALIGSMISHSQQAGLPAVVLTFFPHPALVLRGYHPSFYITAPEEKAALIQALGPQYLITQSFDRDLSQTRALDFIVQVHSLLQFRHLWVSESFALGNQREGDSRFLQQAGGQLGFQLHVVPPTLVDGVMASSTQVREALQQGNVTRAAKLLGRTFVIPGVVVSGSGRGRNLGTPTANLSLWSEQAFPANGVYACVAQVRGQEWDAVGNIGVRPTFDDNLQQPIVEANLLDFTGELYGQKMRLGFIQRLRDEKRFSRPEDLTKQIERDALQARRILKGFKEQVDA